MKKLRFRRLCGFYSDEVTKGGRRRARFAASRAHTGEGDIRALRMSSQEKRPCSCTGMGGVKCHTVEVVFSRHHPSPFSSSFSTELTFKLWHQLPCQTGLPFPSLHLPRLPPGCLASCCAPPPSFPLNPSLSSSAHPIHKIPG